MRKVDKIIPKRAHKKGSMPGMTGAQAMRKRKIEDEDEEEEKFIYPQRTATEEEKLLLFATALEKLKHQ